MLFASVNFNLEDRERSDRPAVVADDQIKRMVKNYPVHKGHDIAEILYISHMIAVSHLKTIVYVNHFSAETQENELFLKGKIMCDEKWFVYNNLE